MLLDGGSSASGGMMVTGITALSAAIFAAFAAPMILQFLL
jgi:hypothetical protein